MPSPHPKPRVALFVTCLVDLMRPSVGFAAVKLLEDAGCRVEVPVQTCCGQPAYNSGDRGTTRDLAERMIDTFRGYDYVVAPSGSCAGMIRTHYPELFADDPNWLPKAHALGARTYELTSFLVDVLGVTQVDAAFDGAVTYHDSCSGLRELGVKAQPRRLLRSVDGPRRRPRLPHEHRRKTVARRSADRRAPRRRGAGGHDRRAGHRDAGGQ